MLNLPPTQLGSACAPLFLAVLCSHGVSYEATLYSRRSPISEHGQGVTELEGAGSQLTGWFAERGRSSLLSPVSDVDSLALPASMRWSTSLKWVDLKAQQPR